MKSPLETTPPSTRPWWRTAWRLLAVLAIGWTTLCAGFAALALLISRIHPHGTSREAGLVQFFQIFWNAFTTPPWQW